MRSAEKKKKRRLAAEQSRWASESIGGWEIAAESTRQPGWAECEVLQTQTNRYNGRLDNKSESEGILNEKKYYAKWRYVLHFFLLRQPLQGARCRRRQWRRFGLRLNATPDCRVVYESYRRPSVDTSPPERCHPHPLPLNSFSPK